MNEIKNLLSTIAPTLAAAIGGPLSGLVAAILSNVVGVSTESTTEEQMKNIIKNANDYTLSKIKDADRAFSLRLEQIRQEGQKELNRNANIREETKSADLFVSRARPAFLYLFYFILIMIVVVMPMIGIFFHEEMDQFYRNVKAAFYAIPSELWGVFCAGYLGYAGVRTYEKTKGVAK